MAFWDNRFGFKKSVKEDGGSDAMYTEAVLWDMFRQSVEDGSLVEALHSGGPLGANAHNRLDNYKKIGDRDSASGYLSMSKLRRYIELGWSLYDFDPILCQGVNSRSLYTFGQGITMGTRKRSSWGTQLGRVLDEFWFDPCNFSQFSGVESLISLDVQLQIEGNVMLFLWKDPMSGMMQIRPLKTTWVEQVVVGSGDGAPSGKIVGYVMNLADGHAIQNDVGHGTFNRPVKDKRVAYADINADPKDLRDLVGDIDIETEGRIAHLKAWGRPWMGLGVPPILPAIDPSQRYGQYLEDWSIVQGLFRAFALSVVSKGTNKGVHDVVKKWRDNMQNQNELYNPALSSSDADSYSGGNPVAHTMFTGMGMGGNPGTKIEAIKTSGAAEGPDKAREIKFASLCCFWIA